jgi:soluble lytic murein transglycosylase
MSELYALGRIIDARREWFHMVKRLDDEELRATARILADWGWIDRAIFTAARARYWDDLELRFPLRHRTLVDRYADERQLDPAWVYGVLRQESAFTADVRSSAGAVGLMQLMPATARRVAREYKMAAPSDKALIDPETNISLGTGYLRMMLDDLSSNRILATAAYNAGPHRVKRWLPPDTMDADIWIELIPFRETRLYVQRVMAYAAIYERRLGETPTRLSKRMRDIRAKG